MKNPDVMSGFFRFVHSAFLKTLVDGIFGIYSATIIKHRFTI